MSLHKGDERYGRYNDIGRSYFLTDHQGSTIALTGAAGQVQARYHYEAYGETEFEAVEAGFTSSNPYQYTGRENDGTGLYHYRARYYSPTSKRFTQQDALGMVDGPNMYAYVTGNPVSYTDPLGLFKWGDRLPQGFVDFYVAAIDYATGGGTIWARNQLGINGGVDYCSGAYAAGEWAGLAVDLVGLAGLAKAAGKFLLKRGGSNSLKGLTRQQQKGIRSLEKRIAEHKKKLQEFRDNPTVRPGMGDLPQDLIRKQQRIRIRHLESEIETFRNNIEKIKRGELGQ